ncbi:MAG: DMT family transporter [Paracoccaceae bacterium]
MTTMSNNMRGSLLMLASMAAFVFNDVCMKALSDEIPLFQAVFIRGIGSSIVLYLLVKNLGGFDFRYSRQDWWLIVLRTVAEIAAAYFFLTALFNMPIANATAILQALPLSVTLAGAVFLGEAVGWRRMIAILIGFVGVMLIVQPGTNGFNTYSIYALLAVVSVTVRDLAVRKLSMDVPSLNVALIGALAVTVFAGLASFSEQWVSPSLLAWAQLAGASVFIIGGYVFSIMTMRVGDISAITPFRYTSLIWALLLGFIIFGEWPNSVALLGATIVVATGVFTLMRERALDLAHQSQSRQ